MNIYSAIRNLRGGQAVKPSSWRGYVERIDKPIAESEYDAAGGTYSIGDKVKYNNRRYVCVTAVGTPEAFDSAKWLAIGQDYNIIFVDADDTGAKANPSAVYTAEIGTSNESVTWGRLKSGDPIPAEVIAVHTSWSTAPSPVDMPDAELFKVLLSDAWESGNASDYETQRIGGGGRW